MQFLACLFLLCGLVFQVCSAVPVYYTQMYPRYAPRMCVKRGYLCGYGTRGRYMPYMISKPATYDPLMRQMFTTVTRQHNTLNTAKASHNTGFNAKYQAGPSMEMQGMSSAMMRGKEYGGEMSFDPMMENEMLGHEMPMQYE
ncbi:hypothetical protein K493DRAFT_300103 [Basidiobolus meristosporus CBS 931.73]|uniref:Uncharacterized protein n=1 Tax=Basidiobolus meristosporus CBS 931.73 TaxID=1314790 RepID=A0A1Y1YKI3_9FUNG|nr:hypothetical protein K493DRAFT_300103 [Basidiobolus meristosporus CBS 931.73]|eukprot:ORX98104.1 hypothetical protein K493DRAFT_300103 [Basidiobolus meristosporus CBS 931.73]